MNENQLLFIFILIIPILLTYFVLRPFLLRSKHWWSYLLKWLVVTAVPCLSFWVWTSFVPATFKVFGTIEYRYITGLIMASIFFFILGGIYFYKNHPSSNEE